MTPVIYPRAMTDVDPDTVPPADDDDDDDTDDDDTDT